MDIFSQLTTALCCTKSMEQIDANNIFISSL